MPAGKLRNLAGLPLVAVISLAGTACDGPLIPADSFPARVSLQRVGGAQIALSRSQSCDDLEGLMRQRLSDGLDTDLDAILQYALGMATDPGSYCKPAPPDPCGGLAGLFGCALSTDRAFGPDGFETDGAESVSSTNNQVQGVDEADLVKNDNQYIYVVAGQELIITKAWPAAETEIVSRRNVAGTPKRLFVVGDRAVVFSDTGDPQCDYHEYDAHPQLSGVGLHVTVFDISDRSAPILERETMVNGLYTSARRIDDTIHIILSFPELFDANIQMWPDDLPWNLCDGDTSEEDIRAAFEALKRKDRDVVAGAEFVGSIPSIVDIDYADGVAASSPQETPVPCESVLLPDNTYANGFLSVMSFASDDDTSMATTTVLGNRGTVYASHNGVYIAVSESNGFNGSMRTLVHELGFQGADEPAEYRGTGEVPGQIINQFSMDEHAGYFRIATTEGHIPSSSNNLFVLQRSTAVGGTLPIVGSIRNIAPTEDIRSVRFDGDRAFMVTFKKTDPLFTFDLANPADPQILGALKIPGFSTYMHFLDEDHLLTIGFDADEQGSFAWFQGVLLQIFDVSDMTAPVLSHREVLGTRGSSSDATADHLAFTFHNGMLAIPIDECGSSAGGGAHGENLVFSGLVVFDVDTGSGFTLRGRVDHAESYFGANGGGEYCGDWWQTPSSSVKRSVIMDDFVYSLSSGLLKVNDLRSMDVDLASLSLPPLNDTAPYCYGW